MARRRPKVAILGSRICPPQTRSLVDEPAGRLSPEKSPGLLVVENPSSNFGVTPPSLGGPARSALGGGCGFSLHQRVPPIPHPRWYSNIAYDSAPSVLKAALGRVRLPAVGVAGLKSLPLARRVGASFQRPLECIRTSYRSNFVDRYPSGPRSTFTEYALPTGRGLTCGDG